MVSNLLGTLGEIVLPGELEPWYGRSGTMFFLGIVLGLGSFVCFSFFDTSFSLPQILLVIGLVLITIPWGNRESQAASAWQTVTTEDSSVETSTVKPRFRRFRS
jgi:hypothetical protein